MADTYPIRDRNHEIESLSERFLKNCLPINWVVNTFQVDYGTDYNCEITIDNKVIGHNFTIQLKGKEKELNSNSVKIKLKRSTINRWLNRLEPTMIVCYIVEENCGYWTWFRDDTADLTLNNETFTISISKTNKLTSIKWDEISNEVSKVFNKRYLLYEAPKFDDANIIAWQAFFDKKYEKATSIFYEFIRTNPNDPSILQGLALSEYHLFNYQKALININKAIDLEKSDVFYINKASILVEMGFLSNDEPKISEAIQLFTKVIEKGYESDAIFYNYGNAFLKLKDYKNAILYLKKAITINPNKSEAWNNLGNCYMNIGEHELEMVAYNKALLLYPDSGETLFSKGSSLFRHFGDSENGLKYMLQGAKKTERYLIDNPYVFFWISEAYLSLNKIDESELWNSNGLSYFLSDSFLLSQRDRIKRKKENNK